MLWARILLPINVTRHQSLPVQISKGKKPSYISQDILLWCLFFSFVQLSSTQNTDLFLKLLLKVILELKSFTFKDILKTHYISGPLRVSTFTFTEDYRLVQFHNPLEASTRDNRNGYSNVITLAERETKGISPVPKCLGLKCKCAVTQLQFKIHTHLGSTTELFRAQFSLTTQPFCLGFPIAFFFCFWLHM